MHVSIKLRDGFKDDTVTIGVDGKQVYHQSGVSTDLTISFADALEVPVTATSIQLKVTVLGGPTQTQEIQVDETPFVEVWILGGQMEIRTATAELPML